MKLSEELAQSSKVLASKGFTEEGELLGKIAASKVEVFVIVTEGYDSPMSLDAHSDCVFLSQSKAEEALMAATSQYLRDHSKYLFYTLDEANNRHHSHIESEVSEKASSIFGIEIAFNYDEFKLPEGATDQQLVEFAAYLGYTPVVLEKITIEV